MWPGRRYRRLRLRLVPPARSKQIIWTYTYRVKNHSQEPRASVRRRVVRINQPSTRAFNQSCSQSINQSINPSTHQATSRDRKVKIRSFQIPPPPPPPPHYHNLLHLHPRTKQGKRQIGAQSRGGRGKELLPCLLCYTYRPRCPLVPHCRHSPSHRPTARPRCCCQRNHPRLRRPSCCCRCTPPRLPRRATPPRPLPPRRRLRLRLRSLPSVCANPPARLPACTVSTVHRCYFFEAGKRVELN